MLPLVFHCLDSNIFWFGYFISMQTIQKSNPIYQFEYVNYKEACTCTTNWYFYFDVQLSSGKYFSTQ